MSHLRASAQLSGESQRAFTPACHNLAARQLATHTSAKHLTELTAALQHEGRSHHKAAQTKTSCRRANQQCRAKGYDTRRPPRKGHAASMSSHTRKPARHNHMHMRTHQHPKQSSSHTARNVAVTTRQQACCNAHDPFHMQHDRKPVRQAGDSIPLSLTWIGQRHTSRNPVGPIEGAQCHEPLMEGA
jgi:hypothetical protein